ncbi:MULTISPECIES: hypothetical protein [Grimontia]|nr:MULTISPECIES: hypothetical protein [Grimontia]WRV99057.1 hypothetical protein VP504_06460 [Grimontia sp. NTOU-MAR1]
MALQPDPYNQPVLEPGSQAEYGGDDSRSNEEKLLQLESNSDAISPQIAEENQELESLPK